MVELAEDLVHPVKPCGILLHHCKIINRDILGITDVVADDPLSQRLNDLPDLIVNESEQVPGINIVPV